MSRVMLIGAGRVSGVAAAKMCQNPETFGELLVASRTEARCNAIKKDIEKRPWFAKKGKTNIGCIFHGLKDGKPVDYYVYQVCDHQKCYREVGSQAISYTTGVPAMIGAKMFLEGKWTAKGVHTCEEFAPDPFMAALKKQGLPWKENFNPVKVP